MRFDRPVAAGQSAISSEFQVWRARDLTEPMAPQFSTDNLASMRARSYLNTRCGIARGVAMRALDWYLPLNITSLTFYVIGWNELDVQQETQQSEP